MWGMWMKSLVYVTNYVQIYANVWNTEYRWRRRAKQLSVSDVLPINIKYFSFMASFRVILKDAQPHKAQTEPPRLRARFQDDIFYGRVTQKLWVMELRREQERLLTITGNMMGGDLHYIMKFPRIIRSFFYWRQIIVKWDEIYVALKYVAYKQDFVQQRYMYLSNEIFKVMIKFCHLNAYVWR